MPLKDFNQDKTLIRCRISAVPFDLNKTNPKI